MPIDLERARAAKLRLYKLLPASLHINGIGITWVGEDYAIKLNLDSAPPDDVALPRDVDGVPVVVEVVGPLSPQLPERAKRPAPG